MTHMDAGRKETRHSIDFLGSICEIVGAKHVKPYYDTTKIVVGRLHERFPDGAFGKIEEVNIFPWMPHPEKAITSAKFSKSRDKKRVDVFMPVDHAIFSQGDSKELEEYLFAEAVKALTLLAV